MHLPVFIADAFAAGSFTGNPAAVVPLDYWIEDSKMQAIAEQHNLAETAFVLVHPDDSGCRPLRWFTPAREVRLCGHATLASAYILGDVLKFSGDEFRFSTLSGELICKRVFGGWQLDFPADEALPAPDLHELAEQVVGSTLHHDQVFVGRDDAMVVLAKAEDVLSYEPNHFAIRRVPRRGIILTAPGYDNYDVVSRCFYPEFGVDEDPVTGFAHTLLGPYWSKRLGKSNLLCRQASRRGGDVEVHYDKGERVLLSGRARLYLKGEIKF